MDEKFKEFLFEIFKEGFLAGAKHGEIYKPDSLSPSEINQRINHQFINVLYERGLS